MTYSTNKLHRLQQSRAVVVTPSFRRPTASLPKPKLTAEPAKKQKAKTQHHLVGNELFDKMGKRQQKIVRRMAINGDRLAPILGGGWGLWDNDNIDQRPTKVRLKDAHFIDDITFRPLADMLAAVRNHFPETRAVRS